MKKGVALLWVLVLSTVLMIISGTMVNTIIKESRFSVSIEDSVKAYAAAKTGIDWGAAELADEKSTVTDKIITIEKNAAGVSIVTAEVKIDRATKIVTSTGKSGFVRRRLEYHSTTDLGTEIIPINPPHDTPVGPLNESFTLQFDFWGKPNSSTRVNFGLHDTSTIAQISLQIGTDNKLNLRFYNLNTGELLYYPVVTDPINKTPFLWSSNADPYQYRATIKYVKDTSVVLTLREREEYVDVDGKNRVRYGCVAEATADLSTTNINIGTSNSLLTYGTSPTTHSYIAADTDYGDPYLGDGGYLEFVTGDATFIRIDNIIFKGRVGEAIPVPPAPIEIKYLTTTNAGTGSGTITPNPTSDIGCSASGCAYVKDTLITLTATPSDDSGFTGWSGGGCSGTGSCSLMLTDNTNVTATFTKKWIPGVSGSPMAGKFVYYKDLDSKKIWSSISTSCPSASDGSRPCQIGLDANYPLKPVLVSPQIYPAIPLRDYDAQNACKALGGRLPTSIELYSIYLNKTNYGNNFSADISWSRYWTATQGTADGAAVFVMLTNGSIQPNGTKTANNFVRCIK